MEVQELCRGRFASDERASNDDELRCQHFEILECHQHKDLYAHSSVPAICFTLPLDPQIQLLFIPQGGLVQPLQSWQHPALSATKSSAYTNVRLLQSHQTPLRSSPNSLSSELLYMGREYPLGYDYFRPRLHKAFSAKAHIQDEGEIRKGIEQAEYVRKGMLDFEATTAPFNG
jgi:hypothetical protein